MTKALRTLARRVGEVVAECNEAQTRLLMLRLNPDRYVLVSDQAPDTYREFLFRTSGVLVHEPSATARCRRRETR
jgi:hypothetical protein